MTGKGTPRAKLRGRLEVVGLVVGIVLGLLGISQALTGCVGELLGSGGGRVELRQVVLVNGPEVARVDSGYGPQVQTRASTPQIDVTVRNVGDGPLLLTEARISIEDSAMIAGCTFGGSGGDVPVTGEYAIELPVRPTAEERVLRRPLHQEVDPGRVDRFVIYLRAPPLATGEYLYAIRVELLTEDADHVVDLGRFVVGVPEPVGRFGVSLPEDAGVLEGLRAPYQRRYLLASTWCLRHNLAQLRRLISHPGERSAEVEALAHLQPVEGWLRMLDRRPPRAAVEPLLRTDYPPTGPVLAAFAAAATGDPAFAERTRERAAAELLRRAEAELEDEEGHPASAVTDVRSALELVPSSEGMSLLRQAEAKRALPRPAERASAERVVPAQPVEAGEIGVG